MRWLLSIFGLAPRADRELGGTFENSVHVLNRHLDNFEAAGVTHVEFMAAGDERDTALERQMNGSVLSIKAARRLLASRGSEMPRSVFRGIVKF